MRWTRHSAVSFLLRVSVASRAAEWDVIDLLHCPGRNPDFSVIVAAQSVSCVRKHMRLSQYWWVSPPWEVRDFLQQHHVAAETCSGSAAILSL